MQASGDAERKAAARQGRAARRGSALPIERWHRACRRLLWLGGVVLAAGCAPTLDWREVRVEGSAAAALLPCKPKSASRTVPLAGQPLRRTMQACKAGDWTWALATVDVDDVHRVGAVLDALRQSMQSNLQARVVNSAPAGVRGATPHGGSVRFDLVGQRPDGTPAHAAVVLFVHGTQVIEAVVMGARAPGAAAEPFFEALAVRP